MNGIRSARTISLLGFALAATATGLGAAAQAKAAPDPEERPAPPAVSVTYYQVVAQHSGKCLDAKTGPNYPNGFPFNGTNVRQWVCTGRPNQQWQLIRLANGYHLLKNRGTGKCLDVEASLPYDGSNVHQWTCDASARNQQWRLLYLGSNFHELLARHSNKALDVEDGSTANGADVYQWRYVNGRNQHWRFIPAPH